MNVNPDQLREERFRTCLREHAGIIWKVVHAFRPKPEDERALYQELILRIWETLPRFRGESNLSTWMYGVAFRTALQWRRRESRHRRARELNELADSLTANTPETDPRIEALYAAIRRLPEMDRSLVIMQLDGCTYREMAKSTGLSESNVGARLSRARDQLYHLLQSENHETN